MIMGLLRLLALRETLAQLLLDLSLPDRFTMTAPAGIAHATWALYCPSWPALQFLSSGFEHTRNSLRHFSLSTAIAENSCGPTGLFSVCAHASMHASLGQACTAEFKHVQRQLET